MLEIVNIKYWAMGNVQEVGASVIIISIIFTVTTIIKTTFL